MKRKITFKSKEEKEWTVEEVIREKPISLKEKCNRVNELFKFLGTRLQNLFVHV